MKTFKYICFWLASFTWGLPVALIGSFVALWMLITGHKPHRAGPWVYFRVKKADWWNGADLGPFFLLSENAGNHTIRHEAGHGIQNVMFGPWMLFIVTIPSAVRCLARSIIEKKKPDKQFPLYDSIWFEGMATCLGGHFLTEDYVSQEKNKNKE